MEYLPFGDFGANALWFSLQVLAYNIFIMQKELILHETYRTMTIGTVRWRLIQIGAKVVNGARQWKLRIYCALKRFREYLFILERLLGLKPVGVY